MHVHSNLKTIQYQFQSYETSLKAKKYENRFMLISDGLQIMDID